MTSVNNKINFFSRLLLCFFAITGANYLSCAALPHDEFAQSPKFAVHLGFSGGLPKDGVMDACFNLSSSSYGAIFFSVNGPFPYTEYMALHKCPYAVIVPIKDDFLNNIIGFHPTELVRIGNFTINENCVVIAPNDAAVPGYYTKLGIVQRYHKQVQTTENRDEAVRLAILNKGGLPVKLKLERDRDGKLTWHNFTQAVITCVNGISEGLNVNSKSCFPEIFDGNDTLSYSCPGQGIDDGICRYGRIKSAHLSRIDVQKEFGDLRSYLSGLQNVDPDSRDKFEDDLQTMLKPSVCDKFILFPEFNLSKDV